MEKDFWACFLVSIFWGTNGVFLYFVGEQSLELGSLLFPQIVQYLNKDIFSFPTILCVQNMLVFGDGHLNPTFVQ